MLQRQAQLRRHGPGACVQRTAVEHDGLVEERAHGARVHERHERDVQGAERDHVRRQHLADVDGERNATHHEREAEKEAERQHDEKVAQVRTPRRQRGRRQLPLRHVQLTRVDELLEREKERREDEHVRHHLPLLAVLHEAPRPRPGQRVREKDDAQHRKHIARRVCDHLPAHDRATRPLTRGKVARIDKRRQRRRQLRALVQRRLALQDVHVQDVLERRQRTRDLVPRHRRRVEHRTQGLDPAGDHGGGGENA